MAVAHSVDFLNGQNNFGHVELCLGLVKDVVLEEEVEQAASSNILHNQEEKVVILEGKVELGHPGTL